MENVNIDAVIQAAPDNQIIRNTLHKMHRKLTYYRNPIIAVSGGSDSDIMTDIIERVRGGRKVTYVFFDTGIEYWATLRHLDELESKYGIRIERRKAVVPVPKGCRECGKPFISKQISENISRLQKHGFKWEDKPFEVLIAEYPGCISALKWWCNKNGEGSSFNIRQNKWLKEFLMKYPPQFQISRKCCIGAKEKTAALCDSEFQATLKITGERQAEGGARATANTTCFTVGKGKELSRYRPLFFWKDTDKQQYKEWYGICYSDCYEVYGLPGTGCAGCPFGSGFENELKIIDQYEPRLFAAVHNIFDESYTYMREYRGYRDRRNAEERQAKAEKKRKKVS